MFYAYTMTRYQVSVYRTIGPLGFFIGGVPIIYLFCINAVVDQMYHVTS